MTLNYTISPEGQLRPVYYMYVTGRCTFSHCGVTRLPHGYQTLRKWMLITEGLGPKLRAGYTQLRTLLVSSINDY